MSAPLSGPLTIDLWLARRCVAEAQARERLFRRHAESVYLLARRVLGSASEAEQVTEKVFIRAFRKLHRYRGEAPMQRWLKALTIRLCCGQLRRRGRRVLEQYIDEPEIPGWDVAQSFDDRESLRRIYSLLGQLSIKQRLAFVLYHLEGHPLPEVARMLGSSQRAARRWLSTGRGRLVRLAQQDDVVARLLQASP